MAGISAILTAAGESTRMGFPKPLLEWNGETLVEYQARCLLESGVSEVIVVLGHRANEVKPAVCGRHVSWVVNERYREGKATSIRAGLKCVSLDAESILLLAVDQPRTTEIIAEVIAGHLDSGALITSPRYRGHGGHPLIFSSSLRHDLESISDENQGVREVFERYRENVLELAIDDPMIRLDLNTPEVYEAAKALYRA